jgi:ElaB/YqjD/DUF883 family membrane-anchored ribosome-binding protein
MADAIETAVKADVKSTETSVQTRLQALEIKTESYVKAHVVWLVAALCLIVGAVVGHFVR